MDKEALKGKLADERFLHIYEWHDEPGTEYPAHAHKGRVSMYILEGGLTFWFGNEERTLVQGDRFDVPVGKEHVARVGSAGCTFLVGEMIKGDS
jgi:quercetin dioxygenase-like cupin family protein